MRNRFKVVLIIIIVFSQCVTSFSQSVGKIFTKAKADSLFGKVEQSVEMKTDDVLKMIENTDKKVMFRMLKKNVLLAGDTRNLLNNLKMRISKKDVFMSYSKDKVLELLNKNKNAKVKVEKRGKKLTITCGMETLEEGQPCPPICD